MRYLHEYLKHSIAYPKMRLIMARLLNHFVIELLSETRDWIQRQKYLIYRVNPNFVFI